jgi:hypothetical protein
MQSAENQRNANKFTFNILILRAVYQTLEKKANVYRENMLKLLKDKGLRKNEIAYFCKYLDFTLNIKMLKERIRSIEETRQKIINSNNNNTSNSPSPEKSSADKPEDKKNEKVELTKINENNCSEDEKGSIGGEVKKI